jgi:hypothetical protein
MPPTPRTGVPLVLQHSRVIIYYQTHFHNDQHVSILPLVTKNTGVTHVILAAIHLNDPAGHITLNEDPYAAPRNSIIWDEVRTLQKHGIKVLGMLGGAAQGSFRALDGTEASFVAYYEPLRQMVAQTGLDGLDLDVEEEMSLPGIIRLIDRLKGDFGSNFLITLAPVATAMQNRQHLSGFSYVDLERAMGRHIAWYNTQFYCGWGDMHSTEGFDGIVACGWDPNKIVVGLVSNPENGRGWVQEEFLEATLGAIREDYPTFGGVMGWEYFNCTISTLETSGSKVAPWRWVKMISDILKPQRSSSISAVPQAVIQPPVKNTPAADEKISTNPFGLLFGAERLQSVNDLGESKKPNE